MEPCEENYKEVKDDDVDVMSELIKAKNAAIRIHNMLNSTQTELLKANKDVMVAIIRAQQKLKNVSKLAKEILINSARGV